MIQQETRLDVADNTGAKEVMCIKVLGGTRRRFAGLGDIIVCSVKSVIPGSDVKKKSIVRPSWYDVGSQRGALMEVIYGSTRMRSS